MGSVEQFPAAASRRSPRLMDRVLSELRVRHYSIRTEEAYTAWIRRYIVLMARAVGSEAASLGLNKT